MADAHLLWAALFAWYVVFGAGPVSARTNTVSDLAAFGRYRRRRAGAIFASKR
jgi:hypothetical protein